MLSNFPKPLLGAVNGYAIGVGCIVTFCCDLLVASERAEWRLPQVALGILPAYGGAVRLARWVGKGHAMRLAMGFPLKADEAYRIGLAQWLVPHAEFAGQDHGGGRPSRLSPTAWPPRLAKESLQSRAWTSRISRTPPWWTCIASWPWRPPKTKMKAIGPGVRSASPCFTAAET